MDKWSIRICVRRASMDSLYVHTIAINGDSSSHAPPTPVDKFVAPGPKVETQIPGILLNLPEVSAINAALVSLAVKTKLTVGDIKDMLNSGQMFNSLQPNRENPYNQFEEELKVLEKIEWDEPVRASE